jgi:hypothetical protein
MRGQLDQARKGACHTKWSGPVRPLESRELRIKAANGSEARQIEKRFGRQRKTAEFCRWESQVKRKSAVLTGRGGPARKPKSRVQGSSHWGGLLAAENREVNRDRVPCPQEPNPGGRDV